MTHPRQRPGERTEIVLKPKILHQFEITPEDGLERHERELRHELGEALRYTLRAAIRLTVIKRVCFDAEGRKTAEFIAWTDEHFGIGRRQAFRYVAAGRCIMNHEPHFATLAKCDLIVLAELVKLRPDQMGAFLSAHPHPEQMEREEIVSSIAAYLAGQCLPNTPVPRRARQLELPGLDDLQQYDPAQLDPVREGAYMGVFFHRAGAVVRAKARQMTPEVRAEYLETVTEIEEELKVWRDLLAEEG